MIFSDRDILSILSDYPARIRPIAPPVFLSNAGGFSGAIFWRFESSEGTFALKGWPRGGMNRERLTRIHQALFKARALEFIPVPVIDLQGETFRRSGDRYWEILPWLPGLPDRNRPPSSNRIRAGFHALAALHRLWETPSRYGSSPGLKNRLREIERWISRDFSRLEQALAKARQGKERFLANRWLELARVAARPIAENTRHALTIETALQTCVRDMRADHLLFENDRLTGFIDFGALDEDVVSADLARLMDDWIGVEAAARSEALSAYETLRPLSAAETKLIDAFELTSALLIGGNWARGNWIENRFFEEIDCVANGLTRGIDRLAHRLAQGNLGGPTKSV